MTSCHSGTSTTPIIPDNNISHKSTIIDDHFHHYDICDFLYSKDTLDDTLHFNFENREDFGPVKLSDNELKLLYCEIKRGNIEAYKILFDHYFYSYTPNNIPRAELDNFICITDFLARRHHYYRGYLVCADYIFEYLNYNADEYYATVMIKYYEEYFDSSQSRTVAKKLYKIFCGNYSFHDKDPTKAKYYEGFISSN